MLILKEGVRLTNLVPQMCIALQVAEGLYAKCGADCVVTSANDSSHSINSWHYKGRAIDLRTKNLSTEDSHLILNALKQNLELDFDVILEAEGTDNEHIHIEYDPK